MKDDSRKTIIRHLKGIVAALENKETPMVVTFRGKELDACTDDEVQEALQGTRERSFMLLKNWQSLDVEITKEAQKRGLSLNNDLDSETRKCLYETGQGLKDKKERDALEKDINNILDGKWNNGNKHRMIIRLPLGKRELGVKTQAILVKIAADRRLEVDIESDRERYSIVVFSK